MSSDTRIEVVDHLDGDDVAAVRNLAQRSAAYDGCYPLSEHVMLHLRSGGDRGVSHLLIRDSGQIAAYAHLDVTDTVEGPSAELTVDPLHRRGGLGALLVDRLSDLSHDGRLRLWAHGETAAAGALARDRGFESSRVLWQMRRSLYAALPVSDLPAGVVLRTFLPGLDDDAWVDVNARAFRDLPDQGRWTVEDLHRRMKEPWFDPRGFLVAERDGQMVGFHWTKVHGSAHFGADHDHEHEHGDTDHDHDHGHADHGHGLMGEVYVVGVDPAAQGSGLGRALILAGLHHLRGLGLDQVMLYVDSANARAIRVYLDLGFTHWDTDVLYRRPV